MEKLGQYLSEEKMGLSPAPEETADLTFTDGEHNFPLIITGRGDRLPVDLVQKFLDRFGRENPGTGLDYIHGEETVRKLAEGGNTGILLKGIAKDTFFAGIRAGGHLPRKTFSMGHAHEKRFYMECRKIR